SLDMDTLSGLRPIGLTRDGAAHRRGDRDRGGRIGMYADRLRADGGVLAADGRDLALGDGAQTFGGGSGRIFRLVLAGDDQSAVVVVVEVGVEFGDEAMAAGA